MKIKEYSALALRTESIPEHLKLIATLPKGHQKQLVNYRLTHATLGLASEFNELKEDDANFTEEFGDVFWYLNLLADSIDCSLEGFYEVAKNIGSPMIPVEEIGLASSVICDLTKRVVYYEVDLDFAKEGEQSTRQKLHNEGVRILVALITGISDEMDTQDQTSDIEDAISDVLEKNIKKLEKRYPDLRFNKDHAVNRNLTEEKRALEDELT